MKFCCNFFIQAQGSFTKEQQYDLVKQLRLLACLARHLNINFTFSGPSSSQQPIETKNMEQPLLMVLRPLLPILDNIVDMTSCMPDVVEVICKLLKNSISTLMVNIEPLLPGLLAIIPRLYQSSLNPAVLDVVKHILILFSQPQSLHIEHMKALSDGILSYTLQKITNDLWNNTHIVQAILSFTTTLCKKVFHLLSPHQLHTTFMLAIEALKLPEEGSVKSASSFLSHFLNLCRDHKGVMYKPIIHQNTEHFVRTLMSVICKYIFTYFRNILTHFCAFSN